MMQEGFLIVGLGNPLSRYEKTRHNLGFMVVKALVEKQGLAFKTIERLSGKIAIGLVNDKKLYVLMPLTYMNLSGRAVRSTLDYYRLPLHNLLVIVDDIYLKLGVMRLRAKGSSGGHNGLKNIEASLSSSDYARLRIGVGGASEKSLESYVLENFTADQEACLPAMINKGVMVAISWLTQGIKIAQQLISGNDLT
ncbi:MAG: aminoacyl-tRNA hydrolase [Chlamydiales bacterium]